MFASQKQQEIDHVAVANKLEQLSLTVSLTVPLRRFQKQAIASTCHLLRDSTRKKHAIIQMPTGSGKTLLFHLIGIAYQQTNRNHRILILVPFLNLIKQHEGKLQDLAKMLDPELKESETFKINEFTKGKFSYDTRFAAATFRAVKQANRMEGLKNFLEASSLIIIDEAHGFLTDGATNVAQGFLGRILDSDKAILAITATPSNRLASMVPKYIIDTDFLDAYKCFKNGEKPYLKSIHIYEVTNSATDYDPSHKGIVRMYFEESIRNKKTIIFVKGNNEAKILVNQFNDIAANMAVDCTSNKSPCERIDIIENFSGSKHKILIGTQLLALGVDVSGIDVVFLLNSPKSKKSKSSANKIKQCIGRAIRLEGKNTPVTVFDFSSVLGGLSVRQVFGDTSNSIIFGPTLKRNLGTHSDQKISNLTSHRGQPRLQKIIASQPSYPLARQPHRWARSLPPLHDSIQKVPPCWCSKVTGDPCYLISKNGTIDKMGVFKHWNNFTVPYLRLLYPPQLPLLPSCLPQAVSSIQQRQEPRQSNAQHSFFNDTTGRKRKRCHQESQTPLPKKIKFSQQS